ncbi:MAG: amino acid racemase [Anaerolineaceae bacterium]|nr:amino acid racemase [Anaerolineaceae bacterium]
MMSQSKQYQSIGILGGMGPAAGADAYLRIIQRFQIHRGAWEDADFPEIYLHSIPAPDMMSGTALDAQVETMLREAARHMEQLGMDVIVIACNTAHRFLPAMRAACGTPILSIMEICARELARRQFRHPLLLATRATVESGLYSAPLGAIGIRPLVPSTPDQAQVDGIIDTILRGESNGLRARMEAIIRRAPICDCVILGCTELPLAFGSEPFHLPVIDTLDLLADAAYAFSVGAGS